MKKSYGGAAPEESEAQVQWFGLREISTVTGKGQMGEVLLSSGVGSC